MPLYRFRAKVLTKIFGESWKKEYTRVEKILRKRQERKNQQKTNTDLEVWRRQKRNLILKKIKFLTLKPIRPLPFTN